MMCAQSKQNRYQALIPGGPQTCILFSLVYTLGICVTDVWFYTMQVGCVIGV